MPRWSVGRGAPPRPTTRPRARRSIPEGPAATRRLRRPPQRWPPHRERAGSFPKVRTGAAGIVVRHDRYSQRLYYRHDQPAPYNAGLGRTDRSAKTVPTDWDGRAGFGVVPAGGMSRPHIIRSHNSGRPRCRTSVVGGARASSPTPGTPPRNHARSEWRGQAQDRDPVRAPGAVVGSPVADQGRGGSTCTPSCLKR